MAPNADNERPMGSRLKLIHNQHTGRLKPHHHTSYGGLALVMVLAGIILAGISWSASADTHPPAQSGFVGLTGKMPAKPPSTAATITTPRNGQHFSSSPVTVGGTCPANTIVELYKNNIFAGSGECTDKGTWTFDVDLLYGQNDLVAKVFDALDQQGPDSNTVTVFYDALAQQADPLSLTDFSTLQLLIRTSPVYRGVFPNQALNLPIEILSGSPPYAVSISWGDGTTSLISRADNVSFNANHTYKKAGSYQVIIKVTDTQGRVAFLTTIVIVNGKAEVVGDTTPAATTTTIQTKLLIIWPLYAILAALIIGFFIGEYREKRVLLAAIET